MAIKFRDYKNYPPHLLDAAHFRDDNDDLPDGAFFALAEEQGVDLEELAEFEVNLCMDSITDEIEEKCHCAEEAAIHIITKVCQICGGKK